ncbi:MAG: hypothetical protein O7D86_09195 [Proteobacteria bacterium]|nr:hypothetical protein [Pseudomonadota bacterium]
MQFESNQKRNYWINAFLGLIPDSIIAVIVASFTGSGALGFIFTVIGLQCLYFLIWLKDTIWQWLFFKYRGKQLMVECMENYLKGSNFPAPDEYESSIDGYLNSIVEDEEQEPLLRIKAAGEIGTMNYPVACLRFQESLRLNIAYEEVLKNYKKHLELKSS